MSKENDKKLEASVGMAIVDALPVLCFSAAMLLIGQIYLSPLFIFGAVLCAMAGIGKVLWKFILAIAHKDVPILYRQFHHLMPAGFVLIVFSLIATRPSLTVLWKNVSSFPCNILFLIAIAGMIVMGILAVKMDSASKKTNWIEQIVNFVAQLCILLAVIIIWYGSDCYHADAVAEQYLQSTDAVQVMYLQGTDVIETGDQINTDVQQETEVQQDTNEDQSSDSVSVTTISNGIFFDGNGTDTALIFYPGAKVEYTAYAPLMMELAENGVDCFLLEMPYNMAIFGLNRADAIMESYSYDHWYLAGHSLGGAMAASYAANHTNQLDGLILFAAYATSSLGDLPTLAIYGGEDGVLNMEKLEDGVQYAQDYTEVCIAGGNHAGFGSYGVQSGDGEASITQEEQWEQTVEEIMGWME